MAGLSLSLDLSRLKSEQSEPEKTVRQRDLIVIGAGPAGLTAGIYAGRALLQPLLLVGQTLGGQAALTDLTENYPGFPEGVSGMDITQKMAEQAQRFGAEIAYEEVTAVDLASYPFRIQTYGDAFLAKSIIVCTGASPRKLGVPGEAELTGHGVSYCATCDAFFYRDKDIVVVGGGDAAIDESLYLTRFVNSITIIHRRDQLRASPTLQARAMRNEKIRFVLDSVVDEIVGQESVQSVRVHNVKTGEASEIATQGVFVYVGMVPNTSIFQGKLDLTPDGYIVTDRQYRTNVPGVFAAGDVQDPVYRQTIVAAGAGASAAIEAERFLAEKAFEAQEEPR
ncbi:MAG: thioredoxin-disulfide reductase [Anaerolineae bacterium]|jgi:thioredoxin reductase (NADPH)